MNKSTRDRPNFVYDTTNNAVRRFLLVSFSAETILDISLLWSKM